MCEVGTRLTHNGTDAVANLCMTEQTSTWQYTVTSDGRRRRLCSSTPGTKEAGEALNTLLRLGEATAGSVEILLAGRADDGLGVTAY